MDPDLGERAALESAARVPPSEDVTRFEWPTRLAHWVLAGPFLVLLLSGLTNYFPTLKATQLAGERLFALLHVVTGFGAIAAILVIALPLLGRRSARADLEAVARLGVDDYLWFQHAALRATGQHSVAPPVRKFNAGQKVNALLSLGATALLMGSGVVLGVNFFSKRFFAAEFVESVFPWHTWVALLFAPVLLGHLYLALVHPSTREALRGITGGRVRRAWAARHHPAWLAEIEARPPGQR
ncbi:MAG: cytochrome b/b6 domain-containing protein [Dehalococcoidia bacterium]|nr:cytochrome b/b6 domain-containing protein [Dehalococcoidia bacterium]